MMNALRTIGTLLHSSWLMALSYRLNMLMSIGGLVFSVVPIYFVATALQPTMASKIAQEGGQFFAFVLVGGIAVAFVTLALNALPGVIGSSIGSGTFEAILAAPTPLPVALAGLTAYEVVFQLVRSALMLIAGAALGAVFAWTHVASALLILALLVLAYLPLGMIAASLQLAFRTSGPMIPLIIIASTLLGGVYYPTTVIPSWIQKLSVAVPMTYGLRALRQVLLRGLPISDTIGELGALLVFIGVGGAIGLAALNWSLAYSRRVGTLSQY